MENMYERKQTLTNFMVKILPHNRGQSSLFRPISEIQCHLLNLKNSICKVVSKSKFSRISISVEAKHKKWGGQFEGGKVVRFACQFFVLLSEPAAYRSKLLLHTSTFCSDKRKIDPVYNRQLFLSF